MIEYPELEQILRRTIKRSERENISYEAWKNKYTIRDEKLFEEIKKKLKIRNCPRDSNGREFFKFKDEDDIESKIIALY